MLNNRKETNKCFLSAVWYSPFPGGSVDTDSLRFWFIPASLRAKGAPFLVTAYDISSFNLDVSLTLKTDIPCRLKVLISTIAPYSDLEVETKRGRAFKHHPILVWQWQWQATQEEPGDTTSHTFTWTAPMANCWYHFQALGTTDGKTSPSRSPFYKVWVEITEPVTICKNTPDFGTFTWGTEPCYRRSYAFTPRSSFIPDTITIWMQKHPSFILADWVQIQIYETLEDAMPRTLIGSSPRTPIPPPLTDPTPITFPLTCPALQAGQHYAFDYWWSYYPRLKPKKFCNVFAGVSDTCPHPQPLTYRTFLLNCSAPYNLPCNCTGKAWERRVTTAPNYEIKGYPV